jgi:hypothetical protein
MPTPRTTVLTRDAKHLQLSRRGLVGCAVAVAGAAFGLTDSAAAASPKPRRGSAKPTPTTTSSTTAPAPSPTTTTTAAPTTPPAFTLGETEPTWDNSGCRIPLAELTRDTRTNLVTSYDGQVIEGLHLPYGRIEVRHRNVTIRDCYIQIGYDASRTYIQNNCAVVAHPSYDTSGLVMEPVTCDPLNAGAGGTPDDAQVSGFYFVAGTAYRCAVRNVTDGFMPDVSSFSRAPSQVLGSYVQTRYLPYDKEQSDGTHNDGVQLAGGDGHVIRGNALHNPAGSTTVKGQCVVFTPYHGSLNDCVVDRNWFYGAYTQLAAWVPASYGPQPLRVTFTGNRHAGQCVWPLLITPAVSDNAASIGGNAAGVGGLTWNDGRTAEGAPVAPYVANA